MYLEGNRAVPCWKPLGLKGCAFPWGWRFLQTLAHRFQFSRWLREIRYCLSGHTATEHKLNVHVYPVCFIVFPSFKTNAYAVINWPHVGQSGFQTPGNFCCRNLKSWALESGIHPKESEIPLTFGIWDPSSTYKESRIQNPLRGVQKQGWFLVLWKPLLVCFCVVVLALLGFFSIVVWWLHLFALPRNWIQACFELPFLG